ncbi:adenosine deaminase/editase [Xylogone sp. PMI_703]|nr:adenosine deaminase/editase [Xylogone sp. PMI_703]
MDISGDAIAQVVLEQFDKLPAKRKPQVRGDGVREWVPLSGIVAQGTNSLTCLSVATGMKCLPQSKIPQAQGIVLHDWHAEVLAIRSFNRFLLEECHALVTSQKQVSDYIRYRTQEERTDELFQPFALIEGIKLHMYCSEAPCGDASMELTMAAQEDATPWAIPPSMSASTDTTSAPPYLDTIPSQTPTPSLPGRSYFSALGIVRRKPSRPDAPPTLSKSCSDKLSLVQCTSLLNSLTSTLVSPANVYIHKLVLHESQYCKIACDRAFGCSEAGRMGKLTGMTWRGGYMFTPFEVCTTKLEFKYSRRCKEADHGVKLVAGNAAASWTANGKEETLVGGVLQGRKQFDIKGASRMSKRQIWRLALETAGLVRLSTIESMLSEKYYKDIKDGALLRDRRRVKEDARQLGLKGWVRNRGDEFNVGDVESYEERSLTK